METYKLSDEAEADLIRIHQWGVRQFGEAQADEYFYAFFKHFEALARDPLLYAETDIRPGYRKSLCGRDSVYYRINGDTVEIMAIIGQQDAVNWL